MKLLSVICAIGILLLSALTNALPNPVALPGAISEGELEIVARDTDGGADEAVRSSKVKAKLAAREPMYCWRGWDKPGFQGNTVQLCCFSRCCDFNHHLPPQRLYSAKVTFSPSGGLYLWTKPSCTGQRRWISFEGWRDMSLDPEYYSMSLV